jgi:hypothetical protein
MQDREFKVTIQADILAVVFIIVSAYFAADPIFERFGRLAGYAYYVVGVVVMVMAVVRLFAFYRRPRI